MQAVCVFFLQFFLLLYYVLETAISIKYQGQTLVSEPQMEIYQENGELQPSSDAPTTKLTVVN